MLAMQQQVTGFLCTKVAQRNQRLLKLDDAVVYREFSSIVVTVGTLVRGGKNHYLRQIKERSEDFLFVPSATNLHTIELRRGRKLELCADHFISRAPLPTCLQGVSRSGATRPHLAFCAVP